MTGAFLKNTVKRKHLTGDVSHGKIIVVSDSVTQ